MPLVPAGFGGVTWNGGVVGTLATFNAGATVASGQTLTLTGATVTGLTAASIGAGTFPAAYGFAGRADFGAAVVIAGSSPTTLYDDGFSAPSTATPVHVVNFGGLVSLGLIRVNGTAASPSAVANTNILSQVSFNGRDNTSTLGNGSVIRGIATEAWTSTAHGSRIEIRTIPNTTASDVVALTLGQDQSAVFAGAVSGVTTLAGTGAVSGFTTISCSSTITTGAPTGGAGAWLLGIANSVSPTSPNRTITVSIGGTLYYISAKTTND